MGARHEHIQSLVDASRIRRAALSVDARLSDSAREAALTRETRDTATAIRRYKAGEHRKGLEGLTLPHAISLSGNRRVIIKQVVSAPDDDWLEIVISWTKDGVPRPFSNPWRIVNPPLLVQDAAGDVEIVGQDIDGNEERRTYREDPLAVLTGLMERRLRPVARSPEGEGG